MFLNCIHFVAALCYSLHLHLLSIRLIQAVLLVFLLFTTFSVLISACKNYFHEDLYGIWVFIYCSLVLSFLELWYCLGFWRSIFLFLHLSIGKEKPCLLFFPSPFNKFFFFFLMESSQPTVTLNGLIHIWNSVCS